MNEEKTPALDMIPVDDVKTVIGQKIMDLYLLFKRVDYPEKMAMSVTLFDGYINYSLWENNSEKGNPDIVYDCILLHDE